MNNKGQLWTNLAGGLVVMILIGYILVHAGQLWEFNLEPGAVEDNIPPAEISFFDNLLTYWIPIVVFFTVGFSIIAASRKEGQQWGEY